MRSFIDLVDSDFDLVDDLTLSDDAALVLADCLLVVHRVFKHFVILDAFNYKVSDFG